MNEEIHWAAALVEYSGDRLDWTRQPCLLLNMVTPIGSTSGAT